MEKNLNFRLIGVMLAQLIIFLHVIYKKKF